MLQHPGREALQYRTSTRPSDFPRVCQLEMQCQTERLRPNVTSRQVADVGLAGWWVVRDGAHLVIPQIIHELVNVVRE